MLVLLILLLLIALAVAVALRGAAGRRVLLVVTGLVVTSFAGMWGYGILHRPYMIASWLNLKQPPESLSVKDCLDSGLLTDVDTNCLIEIAPEHFSELLQGYDYRHDSTIDSQVSLATGTRQFALADTYIVTPATFEHGGAVTIYANATRNLAIVNLYVE
jgi:hypothetical protein